MCLAVKYLPRFQTIYVSYSYLFSRSVWGMTEEYWYLMITVQRLAIFHRPCGGQLCLRVSVCLVSTGVSADEFSHDKARLGLFTSRGQTQPPWTHELQFRILPQIWAELRQQKGFILQWADHAGTKCAAQTLTSDISRQTLVSRSPQKHLELITIKWLVKNVSVL